MKQNESELRLKIEHHPIFDIPKEKRLQNRQFASDLTNLVMQLKGFTEKLESRLENIDENISEEDENELERALYYGGKNRNKHFDALSFMESINKAIAGYEKTDDSVFMAYFDRIYSHNLTNAGYNSIKNSVGVQLNKKHRVIYKRICNLCEKQGLDISKLPTRYYDELAEQIGIGAEQFAMIIRTAAIVRNQFSQDAASTDASSEKSQNEKTAIDIPDTNGVNIQDKLDTESLITQGIIDFADLDHSEYPRLFFTNDTLAPMVNKNSDVNPLEYCSILEKYENILWNSIFKREYIEFVFVPPPSPDCTRNLLDAQMLMPMQDASIAKYKGVSKAAVSKQREKYTKLQTELKSKVA